MNALFSNPIYILPVLWGIIAIAFIIYRFMNKKRAKRKLNAGHITIAGASKRKDSTYFLYLFYTNFPLTKRRFNKLKVKLRLIYPADELSVRTETTKTMTRGFIKGGITFGVIALLSIANIFFAGEISYYYMLLGLLLGYRSFNNATRLRLEQAEYRLLKQYSDFLFNDLVPAYQKKRGRIDDAIFSILDNLPVLMNLHASKMYDVITAPHLADAAAEYAEYSPSPYFTSLVSLIVPIKIHGDQEISDGKTVFIEGIMNLNRQLNQELLMRQKIDAAFSSLSAITLMGVFAIQPIYWFFLKFFPGTRSFFTTGIATACMMGIFGITFLCNYFLDNMKITIRRDTKEESIWKKIAGNKKLEPILNVQHKKHFTYMERIDKQMHSIGDHTGVHAHMVQCAAWALIAFIGMNVLFGASVITKASNLMHDYANEFDNALTPSEEYTAQMEALGEAVSVSHRGDHLSSENMEEIKAEIRAHESNQLIKSDEFVEPVAQAVITRNQKYHKLSFQFWYEFIALAVAVVAFNIPTWLLTFKAKQSEMGKEDEVNSFNLLATIFMHMEGTKVETLLEWMERFANFYKTAITECIITYPMGKQKALEKLAAYDDLSTYRKFCESLINIDRVGMQRAFEDIQIQQEFYNDKRKADNEILISKKKATASAIAFVPFWSTVGLWLLPPMIVYAYNLIMQFVVQINSL